MHSVAQYRQCQSPWSQRFYSSLRLHPQGLFHLALVAFNVFIIWLNWICFLGKCLLSIHLFSLKNMCILHHKLVFKAQKEANNNSKTKQTNRQKQSSISSEKNAMTFKLQLHFLLPWERPRQGPRPLADREHILSFPHCSWHHGSCAASRIFDLTRLFLSGSGREQGSCQFESWVHTWQSRLDRHSGGRCHVHAIRAPVTWSSLPVPPNNSTGFKLSCPERASLPFGQLICFWH